MTTKRLRVVRSKPSKGGCRTCRLRRVKCDEIRPKCHKCVSTGRVCDGYEPGCSPPNTSNPRRQILPSISPESASWSLVSPIWFSSSIPTSTNYERNAFRFFVSETALPLRRISPAGDWIELALQLAPNNQAIFQAIAAVGAANNAQIGTVHHTFTRMESLTMQDPALEQYCKATAALQRHIDHALHEQAGTETILICCLLFVVFEVFQGECTIAMSHLRLGRRAIESSSISRKNGGEVAKLLMVFGFLLGEAYDRHNFSLSDGKPKPALRSEIYLPQSLSSFEQAKEAFDEIALASSRLQTDLVKSAGDSLSLPDHESMSEASRFCAAHCLSRMIDEKTSPSIFRRIADILEKHRSWMELFRRFERKHDNGESRTSMLLHLQYFFSFFTLTTASEVNPASSHWESEFVTILDMADQFLNCTSVPITSRRPHGPNIEPQQSFSLETALLPALFLICVKCKLKPIRARALRLLQSAHRREGVEWSGEMAVYAECIIRLEEQAASHLRMRRIQNNQDRIPEQACFLDIVLEDVSFHEFKIIGGRFKHECSGQLEITVYRGWGPEPPQLELLNQTTYPLLT